MPCRTAHSRGPKAPLPAESPSAQPPLGMLPQVVFTVCVHTTSSLSGPAGLLEALSCSAEYTALCTGVPPPCPQDTSSRHTPVPEAQPPTEAAPLASPWSSPDFVFTAEGVWSL